MSSLDVYRALWRHKVLIAVFTLIVVAGTCAMTARQTPRYEASTLLRVQQPAQSAGQALDALDVGQRLTRTYASIIKTRELAEGIRDELGGRVPLSEIIGNVSARPVEDLELLLISARSTSPRRAQSIANAAPRALRSFIEGTSTLPDRLVVIDSAQRPVDPVSPNLKLNVAVALVLGLIFNGALALLLEFLSDRLPDADELGSAIGRPVLATVPRLTFPPQVSGNGVAYGKREQELVDALARDGFGRSNMASGSQAQDRP